MIDLIKLIRNVGQFDSVASGAQLQFKKLTLIYAENGRGKTTLAAILRSLSNGDPMPVIERKRLAAANPPYIVIVPSGGGQSALFSNGGWTRQLSDIAVFDDVFVTENIYSGLEVETGHRQRLHELILGTHGIALNDEYQAYVDLVEQHISALRARADAIPEAVRGPFTVETFCDLAERDDIDEAVLRAERSLAAGREAAAVRGQPVFEALTLPRFHLDAVATMLARDLPGLDAAAAARVKEHMDGLGRGGEGWAAEGMKRVSGDACPFCGQALHGSDLIEAYRQYFSAAYDELKRSIGESLSSVRKDHSGDVMAAFERSVRVAVERRQFWSKFTDVPELAIDTAEIGRSWRAVQESVIAALEAKQDAPLERTDLAPDVIALGDDYECKRAALHATSEGLQKVNHAIALAGR